MKSEDSIKAMLEKVPAIQPAEQRIHDLEELVQKLKAKLNEVIVLLNAMNKDDDKDIKQ